jgi:hypothetical protein
MNYAGEGEATSMFENNSTGVCTDRTRTQVLLLVIRTHAASSEIRFI